MEQVRILLVGTVELELGTGIKDPESGKLVVQGTTLALQVAARTSFLFLNPRVFWCPQDYQLG